MSEEQNPPPRYWNADELPEPLGHILRMIERLTEQVRAGDEATQRKFDFIVEQQAQLTATVGRLAEKVDRNAESATALLAIAEIHDREIKETDERLNALINTVERHISEGRDGKDGQ